ncbi:MAG: Competence protein ComEC [Candidatus Amesbacteria bacterium GW2011_GWA2_42_12]|uniref:Competence protein ComEC n=1 Tax=Candidatus Amesbacteria bacterium GW2011_GWA2_42_12 TaxID=1618356 RepID=A0A0G1AE57_9BACT|nr:MAG: Competence protein ComEC [Candidatus Amesbacteria bacterium GW2011_GWA2_42_12]
MLTLACLAIWSAVLVLPDRKLHVVVCDVGQGDAILITKGTFQMLIDGGPDDSVLNCLSKYMPFYDRRIEIAMLTHPQADHLDGLITVAKRYDILQFVIGKQSNSTLGFKNLWQEINTKKIPTVDLYAGNNIKINQDLEFIVVWPTRRFNTNDLNGYAISGILKYGDFKILLTGDADSDIELAEMDTGLLMPVDVLKVPHHGSKTGMIASWLRLISPKVAIISVGKFNNYGHPTPRALNMLAKITDKIYRTDQNGSVEVVSDGRMWGIYDK